ncbi:Phosphomannomutase [Pseudoloma neurophilia]|uniref:Phosphomannomutase n=1 Tax=Pseudoloma neurophilia TaxID=146866 RepID=A0A0R0LTU9_9MICR|nr:Phosphomannomutase [Pseudoloma neurophilia]
MVKNILFLFDVDGTLTPARQKISHEMLKFLKLLRQHVKIAFVGGSDLVKQKEQVSNDILDFFDYSFPENGLSFYSGNKLIKSTSIIDYLGESNIQNVINDTLSFLSKIKLPFKRGTFIELRTSMLNVSPPGRTCSMEERKKFYEYDKIHKIRKSYCQFMKNKHKNMTFSIGGQISVDVFPNGWDKTYCLRHLIPSRLRDYNSLKEAVSSYNEVTPLNDVTPLKEAVSSYNEVTPLKDVVSSYNEIIDRSCNKDCKITNSLRNHVNCQEMCMAGNQTIQSDKIEQGEQNTQQGDKIEQNTEQNIEQDDQNIEQNSEESQEDLVSEIFFFGDMIEEGQNDYELMQHPLVTGVPVKSPEDTMLKCKEILKSKGLF